MIRLVFFARLREDLGAAGESIELPADVTTVDDLRSHLVARGGAWATALAANRAVRVAVNHEMVPPATPLRAGDEVAFFPPVTGG